jgi:hypothetical protein
MSHGGGKRKRWKITQRRRGFAEKRKTEGATEKKEKT